MTEKTYIYIDKSLIELMDIIMLEPVVLDGTIVKKYITASYG